MSTMKQYGFLRMPVMADFFGMDPTADVVEVADEVGAVPLLLSSFNVSMMVVTYFRCLVLSVEVSHLMRTWLVSGMACTVVAKVEK